MMTKEPALYSSRIARLVIEYVQHHYPSLDSDQLLAYAEIQRHELNDPGHWLTQRQSDQLYEIALTNTRNPQLAREVGQYAAYASASKLIRQYATGFMTPRVAYWLIAKLGVFFTRATTFKSQHLSGNAAEVVVTPKSGVQERAYQCDNRIGMFEALAHWFTTDFASVDHPECLHRGAAACRYLITWKTPPEVLWQRARNHALVFALILLVGWGVMRPDRFWLPGGLLTGVTLLWGWYAEHRIAASVKHALKESSATAHSLLEETTIRYNHVRLLQELSQMLAPLRDREALVQAVVQVLQQRLDFACGMVWLADHGSAALRYVAGYGLSVEQTALLRDTPFPLPQQNAAGILPMMIHAPQALLFENHQALAHQMTEAEGPLVQQLAIHALIGVSLAYEGQIFGLLAVAQRDVVRPLTQTDVHLLTVVAAQVAVNLGYLASFEQIRHSEEKYRTILKSIEDGYYEIDLRGNFTFFNEAFCQLIGYASEELRGMNGRWLTDAATRPEVFRMFQRVYRTAEPTQTYAWTYFRKDGAQRVMETSISLMHAPDGRPTGFRGIARDVTERNAAEAVIKASLHEKEVLLKEIHHRVKNNLQVISSLLNLQAPLLHDERDRSMFHESRQRVKTMALIHEKLYQSGDLSRIHVREYVTTLVRELVASYQPSAATIAVVLDVADIPCEIDTAIPCGLIINELVSNALKYAFSTGNGTLTLQLAAVDGAYELVISDNGIGLPEGFALNQLESLGLQLVQGLVEEQLDGQLTVSSQPGQGTRWTIRFREP